MPRFQPCKEMLLLFVGLFTAGEAFVLPRTRLLQHTTPRMMMPDVITGMSDALAQSMPAFSSQLMAFTDQGQNLAGIFFQASLLPYLLFLYFLQFRGNRLSDTANLGFQYVLLFVISTIPSGIVSRSVYGTSLANVDYLHGGAELLLTVANVLIVFGLNSAMTQQETNHPKTRNIALAIAAAFAGCLVLGPQLIADPHTPFLAGVGNLPTEWVNQLPFVSHNEPENALSIPTWAIHFSSVFEYLFAMNLVWQFAEVTQNEKWKGLTWAMLPLHASGICACTYHFFYNDPSLQFVVTSQAGLTLLGNLTCMIAAFRLARSNGWTLDEINPFPKNPTSPTGLVADGIAAVPLQTKAIEQTNVELAAKLAGATLLSSYAMKYGELALDVPFTVNPIIATAMIAGIPAITAYQYYSKSNGDGEGFKLPSMGDAGLSMQDVKKFGLAGTLAYVLTELAFWIVAFPVAGTALYQSTGHWPDVFNDNTDRAAVLAFIFAGANIARAFVPVRLGAALALAPWVDENILSKMDKKASE